MGQILGLGITHYPGLSIQGNLARRIKMCLADPALPERLRSIENWPEPMRREWSMDDGQGHSDAHRHLHACRQGTLEPSAMLVGSSLGTVTEIRH